jgi:hypothetical protein
MSGATGDRVPVMLLFNSWRILGPDDGRRRLARQTYLHRKADACYGQCPTEHYSLEQEEQEEL